MKTMKNGKASRAVLDRSVLRPLRLAGASAQGVGHGADAAFCGGGNSLCSTICTAPVGDPFDLTPEMIMASAQNSMSAAGGIQAGLMTGIVFPADRPEEELRQLVERCAAWAAACKVPIVGGHTQISGAVKRPVLTITCIGTADPEAGRDVPVTGQKVLKAGQEAREMTLAETENARLQADGAGRGCAAHAGSLRLPGQALLMTGMAGWAGTSLLAKAGDEAFRSRYPARLRYDAEAFADRLLIRDAARCALQCGAQGMHDVSQGGVFGALWELSEQTGCGFTADLRAIPIRQETIEICEWYDLNPYQLFGQGALLMWTDDEERLQQGLSQAGFSAVLIGRLTEGNEKIMINGQERRYLEKPQQDMLWKMQEV